MKTRTNTSSHLPPDSKLHGGFQHPNDFITQSPASMAGPYRNFPNYGMYTPYYGTGQINGPPIPQPNSYYGGNVQFQQPVLDPVTTQFPEFDDPNQAILPAQGSARTRRRVGPGGDHVKFRRTRSGCFTCRNRRVKVGLIFLFTD